jgi:hypothetical protein
MDPVQKDYCFGLNYSVTAMRVSHERLIDSLSARGDSIGYSDSAWDRMTLDAWSIIDWAHRLRGLILKTPELQLREPAVRIVLIELRKVKEFRDYIQHLGSDLQVNGSHYAWGVIQSSARFDPITQSSVTYSVEIARGSLRVHLTDIVATADLFSQRLRISQELKGWLDSEDRIPLVVDL